MYVRNIPNFTLEEFKDYMNAKKYFMDIYVMLEGILLDDDDYDVISFFSYDDKLL